MRNPPQTFAEFIDRIIELTLDGVVPALAALALFFFFWGIADWILSLSSGEAEKAKKGRERMVWGVVALFFLFSIAGMVSVLTNTFLTPGTNHSTPREINREINQGVQGSTVSVEERSCLDLGIVDYCWRPRR